MQWILIINYFGPHIQHISGVDNKVLNTMIRIPTAAYNQSGTITNRYLWHANIMFTTGKEYINNIDLPLDLSLLRIEKITIKITTQRL